MKDEITNFLKAVKIISQFHRVRKVFQFHNRAIIFRRVFIVRWVPVGIRRLGLLGTSQV